MPPPTIRISYELFENAPASLVVLAGMVDAVRGFDGLAGTRGEHDQGCDGGFHMQRHRIRSNKGVALLFVRAGM